MSKHDPIVRGEAETSYGRIDAELQRASGDVTVHLRTRDGDLITMTKNASGLAEFTITGQDGQTSKPQVVMNTAILSDVSLATKGGSNFSGKELGQIALDMVMARDTIRTSPAR